MNPSHGYSEGAEVPEDKTIMPIGFILWCRRTGRISKRMRLNSYKMKTRLQWLEEYKQRDLIESRNNAIDECIALVFQGDGDFHHFKSPATVKQELESLKNKPI